MLVQVDSLKVKNEMAEDKIIVDDVTENTLVDDRTITEVAANLRLIADEINGEYTKLSFRNVFVWLQFIAILRRIWIWSRHESKVIEHKIYICKFFLSHFYLENITEWIPEMDF